MQNSGQTCSAWTRMLVPRSRQDEAVELAKAQLAKLTLAIRSTRTPRLGPLARPDSATASSATSSRARRTAPRLSRRRQAGALVHRLLRRADDLLERRQPHDDRAGRDLRPVLAIVPYDSENDAIAIANDSDYGMSGGVWAATPERALGVAKQLRTGQVDINGGRFNALAPFGGYKKSGIGREIGPLALEEFFQLKSIQR
jgi:aldehyde dehydrogenase (NAD+)